MSWSGTGTTTIGKLVEGNFEDIAANPQSDYGTEESKAAIAEALSAVSDLASSVGGEDDEVKVNISGHANPAHTAEGGWAKDYIQVNITRT